MRGTNLRTLRTAAAATVLTLAAFGFTGAHAQAATYDGADPASTYCGGTTSTVSSAAVTRTYGTRIGTISLRYNSGCRTVWAKLTLDSPQPNCGNAGAGIDCATAWVERDSDGVAEGCTIPAGSTSCYTRMLNDANVTSYASASVDGYNGWAFGTTGRY